MKRAFIMVLDSFGIGATEDADRFGDVGSDTPAILQKPAPGARPTMAVKATEFA